MTIKKPEVVASKRCSLCGGAGTGIELNRIGGSVWVGTCSRCIGTGAEKRFVSDEECVKILVNLIRVGYNIIISGGEETLSLIESTLTDNWYDVFNLFPAT